ncbi:hypothetical protein NFI96_029843 [Prochilodus magdalenae]|nr:hypothetical protein NFI96_029843 [Prochilodus magdalenae]
MSNSEFFLLDVYNFILKNVCVLFPVVSPTEYMVEIQADTMDAMMLNGLRNLLKILHLPLTMGDIQITEVNVTTDETCTPGTPTPSITTPIFPITIEVTTLNTTTEIPATSISTETTTQRTTAPNTTTETTATSTSTETSTPSTTTETTTRSTTTETTTPSTTTETTTPVTTTEITTQRSTPAPSATTMANAPVTPSDNQEYTVGLSLTIGEEFDNTLTNQNSEKQQRYSKDIRISVDSVFRRFLKSYKAGSVKVIRFRPGSVVSDFTIVTTTNTLDYLEANRQLVSVLKAQGYNINENSFAQTVENGLYDQSKGDIYPGKDMILTCNPPDSSIVDISWSMNDIVLINSRKYQISTDRRTLTVTSTNSGDNGKYACTMTFNSIPYIIWQRMVIQPLPNVRVSSSKTLNCEGLPVTLECCAEISYRTQWGLDTPTGPQNLTDLKTGCNQYTYTGIDIKECNTGVQIKTFIWEVRDFKGNLYDTNRVRVTATAQRFDCYSDQFGAGNLNDTQTGPCDKDSIGTVTAECQNNTTDNKGFWNPISNNCVLRALQELVERAENLQVAQVPQFTADLREATELNSAKITESEVNLLTVVILLKKIASVSQSFKVDQSIMVDFIRTSDVISSASAQKTWERLNNKNTTQNTSSEFLQSTEDVGKRLADESFGIITNSTELNKTSTNGPFFGTFGINSSTQIEIPEINGQTFITTIVFSTLDNVLPVRNTTYNESTTKANINGDVAAVIINNTVHNISLTFDIKNKSLGNPQCVFWNFSLLDGIGGWDSTGCELKPLNETGTFKCECNHTTSFSLLMSPFFVDSLALAFITFIGVGISMICLILALIIEIIVWKPLTRNDTAYMRHVSIVNIALSLLIADICFIIGAAIVKEGEMTPVGPCSAATFFMHFFYLALFFWMLFSALLLFYRTVMVFSGTSKSIMMAVAFSVGYGTPLLIAVITVAVTAGGGGYIREDNACWLNWSKTMALLAFVIPALTIVAINLLVLIVVLYKMLRRGVGATNQPDEKHALVVIARCVAFLTPLFGLTWGFGIGTMVSPALGIHIVFALLNSLQGFFILVFGILLDSKIREILAGKLKLQNITFSRTKPRDSTKTQQELESWDLEAEQQNKKAQHGYLYNMSNRYSIICYMIFVCFFLAVPPANTEYMIEIEIDTIDVAELHELRTLLETLHLPFVLSDLQITELNITTVCLLNNTGYQCRCEDQYFWPCTTCSAYGHCDNIINVTCGCISGFPNDGQFCQPMTELTNITTCPTPPPTVLFSESAPPAEYMIEIEIDTVDVTELQELRTLLWTFSLPFVISDIKITELNITTVPPPPTEYTAEVQINAVDVAALNQLRYVLKDLNFPFGISGIQITELNITTVCALNSTGYQCRCEDQYLWPCDKCTAYGSCDNIVTDTCGCISGFPEDGQFCQPVTELTNMTACPTPLPTVPPPPTEYTAEVQINAVDVAALNQLRYVLKDLNFPFGISGIQITELNITTVCALNSTRYQCRCEDQYLWPCDKCTAYGSCDNIVTDTCGCISGFPEDDQFCQPVTELTIPPPPTEYTAEVQINAVDVAALNQLRYVLKDLNFPFGISGIQITELNITTVCALNSTGYQCRHDGMSNSITNRHDGMSNSITNRHDGMSNSITNRFMYLLYAPETTKEELDHLVTMPPVMNMKILSVALCALNSTGYQCRCEDQYLWPCDKCTAYGSCDNIVTDTCGCISGFPEDGQFCQPVTELTNMTACPTPLPTVPPPPTEYTAEVQINAVDVAALNQLRYVLKDLNFPFGISGIQITELNITTVCALNSTGYQCRCEDQYLWPCDKCTAYGSCDNIVTDTCGCISGFPEDDQFCQPVTELTSIHDSMSNSITNRLHEIETGSSWNFLTIRNNGRDIVLPGTTAPSTTTETTFLSTTTETTTLSTTTETATPSTTTETTTPIIITETTTPSTTTETTTPIIITETTTPSTTTETTTPSTTTETTTPIIITETTTPSTITETTTPSTSTETASPNTTTETTTPNTTTETTTPNTTTETTTPNTTTETTTPGTTTETATSSITTETDTPSITTETTTPSITTETTTPSITTETDTPSITTEITTLSTTTETTTPSTTTETTTPSTTTETTTPSTTTETTTPKTATPSITTETTTPSITTETATPSTTTETTTLSTTIETTTPNTSTETTTPSITSETATPSITTETTTPSITTETATPSTTTETTTPSTTTETTTLITNKETTTVGTTLSTPTETTTPITETTTPSTTTRITVPETTTGIAAPETTTVPAAPKTTTGIAAPETTTGPAAPETTTGIAAPATTTGLAGPETTKGIVVPKTTTRVNFSETTSGFAVVPEITKKEYTRTLSLTMDKTFENSLTNQMSETYQKYSNEIKSSVDSVYQDKLTSYKSGSAKVIKFRAGSVIADITIVTTSYTIDLSAANKQLVSVLNIKGYGLNENSFAETVENGLYDQSKGDIYPGKDMTLTCNPPDSSIVDIIWSMDDIVLINSRKYQISTDRRTLTVTSTSNVDSGKYACTMTFNSIPYIIWQRMVIQPLPNVQASSSKTLNCEGLPVTLECCAHNSYTTQWGLDTPTGPLNLTGPQTGCNQYIYKDIDAKECNNSVQIRTFIWEVRDPKGNLYDTNRVKITATAKSSLCYNDQFGAGNLNDTQTGPCDKDSVGTVTAQCQYNTTDTGVWKPISDNCVLRALQELVDRAENLKVPDVQQFTNDLWVATDSNSAKITESDVNVLVVVNLMKKIANVSQLFYVDQPIMKDFLQTSDVISSASAQKTWESLNNKSETQNACSEFLQSTEDVGKRLADESFGIITNSTELNKTSTNGPFFGTFGINSSTQIEIPAINGQTFITTIVFSTLDNVLPVRNTTYNESTTKANINGEVAAVIVNNTIHNISLTFDIKNKSLGNPQCVFWNFSLLDGIGGWDSTGCELKPLNQTGKFRCECHHTTSFSLLMSPFFVDSLALAFITFIGVGISMICLILALIIEIIVWKPLTRNDTAFMRHVSIVNIALSLLIADICFIIGAAIVKEGEMTPVGPCSAAAFFMHFFYLALFFWMLFSALLLLHHAVLSLHIMSRSTMMAVAFAVGYGAPLLIAVITVAATAGGGGYIQEKNTCWLNWSKTMALLAFVIPALTIVAINFLVLIVVLYKILRRGVGSISYPDEESAFVVIARCVAILTPLFGLTWGFGIGILVSPAEGIHIVFAVLNSLQGFFILAFGILLDSKTTSAGPASSSGNPGSRSAHNIANGNGSSVDSSSSNSDMFTNT